MFYMSDDSAVEDVDDDIIDFPKDILRRIDQAFDAVGIRDSTAPDVRLNSPTKNFANPSEPGGFILEDSIDGAEGFFVDETSDRTGIHGDGAESNAQYIPLSLIPTALQLLDLQPDDTEVLDVFLNAASGWGGDHSEEGVSRKDWRAVCAVLLGRESVSQSGNGLDSNIETHVDEVESDSDQGDGYTDYDDNDGNEGSDEDYAPGLQETSRVKKGQKTRHACPPSSEDDTPKSLTPRQKCECRKAFGLFFPGVVDADLDGHRLMIKDVARAAKTLMEKLSAEDIAEMLEAFSTSNDRSMTLTDFERMMVAAKMA